MTCLMHLILPRFKAWPILALIAFVMTSFKVAHAALPEEAPSLSTEQATWLIEALMEAEPPVLTPFTFPKEVDRTDKPQVQLLDAWLGHGLLERKAIRFDSVKSYQGKKRRLSVAGYRYTLIPGHQGVTDKGFVIGKSSIKQILSISEPAFIGHTFFCEAYLEWYVANMPSWTKTKLMQARYRLLRRAAESYQKPFEKRYYFEYREDIGWILWKQKPKKMVKPIFE